MSRRSRTNVAGLFAAVALVATATIGIAQVATPSELPAAQTGAQPRSVSIAMDDRPVPGTSGGRRPTTNSTVAANPTSFGTGSSLGSDVARMLAALVIVLAMIGLVYWIVRRFFVGHSGVNSTRIVKVLSRTAIAPRQQVLLLQVGQRIVVVGESAGVLTTLSQIDDADEVAQLLGQMESDQMARAASFGGVFGRSQKTFEDVPLDNDLLASSSTASEDGQDPAHPGSAGDLAEHKSELSGLLEKVRSLRGQVGK